MHRNCLFQSFVEEPLGRSQYRVDQVVIVIAAPRGRLGRLEKPEGYDEEEKEPKQNKLNHCLIQVIVRCFVNRLHRMIIGCVLRTAIATYTLFSRRCERSSGLPKSSSPRRLALPINSTNRLSLAERNRYGLRPSTA